jgi:DNA-binding transcriptional LysR family regulator
MARRLPPLNALRAFEASARLGSFVAAATELRVSAAAVSQQVRRLEEYLDTRLFQRLARGLVLTEQGRDYLPELSAGFDLLGESTARVRAKRADGVLALTTLASFANGWLLPRLHRFRERAPRIDVVIRTSRTLMDFRRDAIDLAIRFAPGPGRGLQGEMLCREELFPVASPQLFRSGRIPDTLAAITEYPLLHDIDAGPVAGLARLVRARRSRHGGSGAWTAVQRFGGVDQRGGGRARHRNRARAAGGSAAGTRTTGARDPGGLDVALELLPHGAAGAFQAAGGAHLRGLGARGSARLAFRR